MLYEGTFKQDFDLAPTSKKPNIAKRQNQTMLRIETLYAIQGDSEKFVLLYRYPKSTLYYPKIGQHSYCKIDQCLVNDLFLSI